MKGCTLGSLSKWALRLRVEYCPPCRLYGCITWPKQGHMRVTPTSLMCHNLERKESFLERQSIHKPLWGTQNAFHLCSEEEKGKGRGFSCSWCCHPCLVALDNLKWEGGRKTKPGAGGDAPGPVSGLIVAAQWPRPSLALLCWREPGSSGTCRAGPSGGHSRWQRDGAGSRAQSCRQCWGPLTSAQCFLMAAGLSLRPGQDTQFPSRLFMLPLDPRISLLLKIRFLLGFALHRIYTCFHYYVLAVKVECSKIHSLPFPGLFSLYM